MMAATDPKAENAAAAASGNMDTPEPILESIPPEIKLKILDYLPHQTLCKSIMPLNREWLEQALHPSLWRDITISVPPDDVACVIRFVARFRGARRVVVEADERDSCARILAQISDAHEESGLQELVLCGRRIGYVPDGVIRVLERCKALKNLSLNRFYLDRLPVELKPDAGRNLVELHLRDCPGFRPGWVAAMTSACPRLELLHFELTDCPEAGVALIADRLKSLRALFLLGDSITAECLRHLAEEGPKLEAFSVELVYPLPEESFLTYFSMPTMKFVKILQDSDYGFSIPMCLEVASAKGALRGVEFTSSGVLDDTVKNDFTFECPSLEWLSLECVARISDGGVTALLEACPNLKVLHVRDDGGRLTGEPWISAVGSLCPQLKIVGLSRSPGVHELPTEKVVEMLKTAAVDNPEMVVMWNGEVLPPNEARYPSEGGSSFWDRLGCRYPRLETLDKYGVPYVGCWSRNFRSCRSDDE